MEFNSGFKGLNLCSADPSLVGIAHTAGWRKRCVREYGQNVCELEHKIFCSHRNFYTKPQSTTKHSLTKVDFRYVLVKLLYFTPVCVYYSPKIHNVSIKLNRKSDFSLL